jgi:hypothetical protein
LFALLSDPDLPLTGVARCLYAIGTRAKLPSDFLAFAANVIDRCDIHSPESLLLRRLLIVLHQIPSQPGIPTPFLASPVPSLYCAGLRSVSQVVLKPPSETALAALLRDNFWVALESFYRFADLPAPSEAFGRLISWLLSHDSCRMVHFQILQAIAEIIPTAEKATFLNMGSIIPTAIQLIPAINDQLRYLCRLSDQLLTQPTSFPLAKIYIAALGQRASKSASRREKEAMVTDHLAMWLTGYQYTESYAMDEIVFEWATLIHEKLGPDQVLGHLCYQFYKHVRFLPLFVGLGRFLRKLRLVLQAGIIQDVIEHTAMVIPCQAHAMAFLLINRVDHTRLAVELAVFGGDCPQSEAILARHPELMEELERVKNAT